MIEPDEIKNLRVPSKRTIEVVQFVGTSEINPEYYEKPYFVVPEDDSQAEAFTVVRKALQTTNKVALGKIAFSGREHIIAVSAPSDDKLPGMYAYTMRYAEEMRKPASYFADIKQTTVEADQLSLAKELIKRKTAKFDPEKFTDQYEAALRELVEAKIQHLPVPQEEPVKKTAKVINLMDALRKSVQSDKAPAPERKPVQKVSAGGSKPNMAVVKPGKTSKRKSA